MAGATDGEGGTSPQPKAHRRCGRSHQPPPWTPEDLTTPKRALSTLRSIESRKGQAEFASAFRKKQDQLEVQDTVLGCLSRTNPVRALCLRIWRSIWFDRVVVAAILLNCLVLALFDPLDKANTGWQNQLGVVTEWPFTVIFTVEMLIKLVSLGVVGPRSYLADGWNWIDGFVVIVGYLSLLPGVDSVSALRTFRVLRPLRTLTRFEGMRVIVQSMLASIPALFNVVLLCAFIFLVFGIIGVQLWSGVLRGRCVYTTPVGEMVSHPDELFCALDCSQYPTTCTHSFGSGCPSFDGLFQNATSGLLQRALMPGACKNVGNPSFGSIGFDNIGLASITIFTSITLEGWVDVMYGLNRAWGIEPVVTAYFVLLIMFGSFFLLNLALAVIWDEYESANTQQELKQQALIDDLQLELRAEVASRRAGPPSQTERGRGRLGSLESADTAFEAALGTPARPSAALAPTPPPENHERAHPGAALLATRTPAAESADSSEQMPRATSSGQAADSRSTGTAAAPKLGGSPATDASPARKGADPAAISKMPTQWQFSDSERRRMGPLEFVANSPTLEMGVSVLIVLNTVTLAMEFHGMSASYRLVLDTCNYVFTAVFALEMVVKMAGLGCKRYCASAFNVFDAVVVIVSLAEIVLALVAADLASGLSALRTFRLMRIFKLAKTWKDLQRLLVTIMRSIVDVASASVVLLIVMFIFVLMGMQLFGAQFTVAAFGDDLPRAHFDNFWWAFVTVFQVLTGENWNEVLFASRKAVGDIAIVYFVALNVVGNYLILNLFLAILLGNFEQAAQDEDDGEAAAVALENQAAPTVGSASSEQLGALHGSVDCRRGGAHPTAAAAAASPQPALALGDRPTTPPGFHEAASRAVQSPAGHAAGMGTPPLHVKRVTQDTAATPSSVLPSAAVSPHRPLTIDDSAANTPTMPARPLDRPSLDVAPAAEDSKATTPPAAGSLPPVRRTQARATGPAAAAPPFLPSPLRPRGLMTEPGGGEQPGPAGRPDVWRFRSLDADMPGSPLSALSTPAARPSSSTEPTAQTQDIKRKSQIIDVKMTYKGKASGTSRMTTTLVDETGRQLAVKITKAGDVSVAQASPSPDSRASREKAGRRLPNDPPEGEAARWPKHYTLCLFSPSNPARRLARAVMTSRFFDNVILALIAVSSILLAVDEPRVGTCKKIPAGDPGSCAGLAAFLLYADIVLTGLFVLEMAIKIVCMGLVMNPHAYLRSGWNVLDFVIVVVSVASLALGDASSLKALRSLRALRALRPLRVVSRYPSLKLVVNSIFGALPKVSNVALVNFLFFLIFAIVGVQNFNGALNSCNDPAVATKSACVGTFNATGALCSMLPTDDAASACAVSASGAPFPRLWRPPPYHFDNVLNGLLTVFEIATGEMWPDIMYLCVDAVGPDQPMRQDNQPAAALFFIFIQVVCAFFMLEVFTGVIIDNFNKLKAASKGSGLLTEEQQTMVESLKMMLTVRPRRVMRPPAPRELFYGCRAPMFAVAESSVFEVCIMGVIMINTVFMAARFYGQPVEWERALDMINLVFNVIFAVEACIKIAGLGLRQYFTVGWNVFDFILVIGGWVGVLFNIGPIATLLRIFRVARIFRLVRTSPGLMQLLRTLIVSIPSLLNVGALLILLFFIFACVGMNLFSDVKHGDFLNSDANFVSFGTAMITLFRVSTGESYNGIMHDAMVQPPFCDPDVNCGDPVLAPIFFIVFYIFSAFVLLNLLVAIILDNFDETKRADDAKSAFRLSEASTEHYREVWAKMDPEGKGMINYDDLVKLMCTLKYPLGLRDHPGVHRGTAVPSVARRVLAELDIQTVNGEQFEFQIVLQALVNNASGGGWAQSEVVAAPKLEVQGELEVAGGLRQAVAVRRIQGLVRARLARVRKIREREAELGRELTEEERAAIPHPSGARTVDKRTLVMMFAVGAAKAANVQLADSTNVDKERAGAEA